MQLRISFRNSVLMCEWIVRDLSFSLMFPFLCTVCHKWYVSDSSLLRLLLFQPATQGKGKGWWRWCTWTEHANSDMWSKVECLSYCILRTSLADHKLDRWSSQIKCVDRSQGSSSMILITKHGRVAYIYVLQDGGSTERDKRWGQDERVRVGNKKMRGWGINNSD